jgi:galactose-6-phosphate isomerase
MSRALLDVTEVLTDPLFIDTGLQRVRLAETIGSDGIAVHTPTTTTFSGSVQPTGDQAKRLEDGTWHASAIEVWTKTELISGEVSVTADQVVWKGAAYTVMKVLDWDYGQGFRRAMCELQPLAPPDS